MGLGGRKVWEWSREREDKPGVGRVNNCRLVRAGRLWSGGEVGVRGQGACRGGGLGMKGIEELLWEGGWNMSDNEVRMEVSVGGVGRKRECAADLGFG